MPASLDAHLPRTCQTHLAPRLGRIARHDVLDGGRVARPSRSVALQPRQSFFRQPLSETSSAILLDVAITASARMLSVAIRCCPSMIAHPRSRVACTTSECMECRASIGKSHGLCHRLLRPPCHPLPARVGVEEHHTAFAPMGCQGLTSPVTQCVQEATLCLACGRCAQTRRIPGTAGVSLGKCPDAGATNCARATSILPSYAHGRHTRRRHRHRARTRLVHDARSYGHGSIYHAL
jgi:hypothetical protein